MIISSVKTINSQSASSYAWMRISQFQNTEFTADVIKKLHNLNTNQLLNARKQAEEIKFCLTQAKEYYDAAKNVTLATRPVLLYYAIMSLALSEILLKQTADSRLEKLRENHNNHGLQLSILDKPLPSHEFIKAASLLVTKQQLRGTNNLVGTFEIWRRSAREYPVGGIQTTNFSNGTTQSGYGLLLIPSDEPPPPIKKDGISLLDCFVELPYMQEVLNMANSSTKLVRANLKSLQHEQSGDPILTAIIQPNEESNIRNFENLVICEPSSVNNIQIKELPSGYVIKTNMNTDKPQIIRWPHSVCLSDTDIYFSCSNTNLSEFGFIYAALHICGNFARYYPDLWMKHIEKNSALALVIGEFINQAFERIPLLSLSELSRTYHVLKS